MALNEWDPALPKAQNAPTADLNTNDHRPALIFGGVKTEAKKMSMNRVGSVFSDDFTDSSGATGSPRTAGGRGKVNGQ
jgi:hypothetical protein